MCSRGAPPLDLPRLGAYLEAHVPSFSGLQRATRLVGGNSNPIWLVDAASGRYIVRTQPAGQLLKSAHALDREVRVMTALYGSAVPVAKLHLLCNDLDVIGVQFYLMDFVEGEVHREVALPDVPMGRRRAVYRAALDTLIDALERALPREAHPIVLLHGDCRLDNLMFEPDGERVRAVLDWELSTLGHPLADLGQFLGVQELSPDYLLPGMAGVDRSALGLPSQRELADHYLRAMNMAPDLDLRFFKAFALFRQAAMSAGLLRRAREGTAVAESALAFGETSAVFAEAGLRVLDSADVR